MPRDSNGNFSLVPSYLAVTGQAITVPQHNPPLEDIATALTGSLPRAGTAPMLANLPMGGFKATDMADGIAPTDGATKAQVDAATPIGLISDWPGAIAPTGWLLCYGQAVSRSEYAALFAICGTAFGSGDGSTTFDLPDLRGRVTAGRDNMGGTDAGRLSAVFGAVARTLGGALGAASHVLTLAQIPSHNHSASMNNGGEHSHVIDIPSRSGFWSGSGSDSNRVSRGNPQGGTNTVTASTETDGGHIHNVTITNSGEDQAHPNVQPTMIMNKIIRAF